GMVVPYVIDRPEVIFADHGANALEGRDGRAHAGFSVEAVGSAAATGVALLACGLALRCVLLPIAGSDIFIGAGHLDAAVSGDRGGFAGGGGDYGIRPQELLFDVEI